MRVADRARGLDVVLDLDLQHRRASEAHEDRRRRDADRDHRVGKARAEKRGERDRQDQERAREHRVGHARDQRVDPAADVAGREPDGDAQRERDRHGHASGEERRARSEDDAREHVAPDLVGPEPVRGTRPFAHGAPARGERIEGGELRRQKRQQDEEDHDAERDHRSAPPRQAHEHAPPRRDFARERSEVGGGGGHSDFGALFPRSSQRVDVWGVTPMRYPLSVD